MPTLGAIFLPYLEPGRLRPVARAADEAGLAELWLWEDCFRESGIASAAVALASTRGLRVGVGLMPVPLRNVALAAMEIATLEGMFPGRLRVAVGHGVQSWMGQVGARASSPLTLLREYVTALRLLLSGEEVSVRGRYVNLDRVKLDWVPEGPVRILVGAEGDLTLRLAGGSADGTVLTAGVTPAGVERAKRLIDEGRAAAGRDDVHAIVAYMHAVTGPGASEQMARDRRFWQESEAADLGAAGDAAAVAAGVRRWAEAGATTVVLQPPADDKQPEDYVRFVARDVQPLVAAP